jgi:membrane protein YqaA with SNARE-associated domain
VIEGYLALFISSFVAATLLPASSEAVLASLIAMDQFDAVALWTTASVGNTLGASVNWLLGRWCMRWSTESWFPFKPPQVERASRVFSKYGAWTLLFSWLPVVGDPLTFVAGLLRTSFPIFVVLVFAGKAGRYAVLAILADRAFN